MINGRVVTFLVLASLFAVVHQMAVMASLYWYFWWFDNFMHFWGGILIVLAVYALSTFSWTNYHPTFRVTLIILIVVTGGWELFEWSAGLYNLDTLQDIIMGFSGGLLAYVILKTDTIG